MIEDDDFSIEDLDLEIFCPKCGNELVHDQNTLPLAESPRGVMFECGKCEEISQWSITYEPLAAKSVLVTWGGQM